MNEPVSLFVDVSKGGWVEHNDARRSPGRVHTVTSPGGALVLAVTSGPTGVA
jgi:hypothetical protein